MLRNKRWSVGRDTDVNVDSDKDVIQTQARGQEACIIKTVGIIEIYNSFLFSTLNVYALKVVQCHGQNFVPHNSKITSKRQTLKVQL